MQPEDSRHGTTRGYHAGCHEACCRRAMARYEKEGRLRRLQGGRAVPALGAQRRLQALMRLGWSSHRIAVEAGLPHRNHVWRILNGQKGKPTVWIQRDTDKWVRDVYDRLSMSIPTGRYVTRTRKHAETQGWPSPLSWDDIDSDDEPRGSARDRWDETSIDEAVVERVLAGDKRPRKLTSAEAAEIVVRSLARGMTGGQIETLYGLKPGRYVKAGKRVA